MTYLVSNAIDVKMIKCDFCSDLSIECFEKARRSRPLKPLQALKDFRIIFDGSGKSSSDGRGEKSPTRFGGQGTHDRPRRARSLSPMKESVATASRDTRKASTTAVPKSTSMNPSQPNGSGKEKRPLQGSASLRSDAAKHGLETASATRMRQGRRVKEVGSTSGDCKASGFPADETTKTGAQTELTRGKTAQTSTKPAVNSRQSQGTSKEPLSQKKRISVGADNTDDNPGRGS